MKWIIAFAILIGSISSSVFGQSLKQTMNAAAAAMQNNQPQQAADFLERAKFFSGDQFLTKDWFLLSEAYLKANKPELSRKTLEAYKLRYPLKDSIFNAWHLQQSRIAFSEEKPEKMMYWLLQMDSWPIKNQKTEYSQLFFISLTLQGKEKEAKSFFINHLLDEDRLTANEFEKYHKQYRRIQRRSTAAAIIMSGVVPGLGQAYAGAWKEAANSMLLNGLVLTGYFVVLQQYGYLEALTFVYPWFFRYYQGGLKKAPQLIKQKQKQAQYAYLNSVL